jgi:hypothetical protein
MDRIINESLEGGTKFRMMQLGVLDWEDLGN